MSGAPGGIFQKVLNRQSGYKTKKTQIESNMELGDRWIGTEIDRNLKISSKYKAEKQVRGGSPRSYYIICNLKEIDKWHRLCKKYSIVVELRLSLGGSQ